MLKAALPTAYRERLRLGAVVAIWQGLFKTLVDSYRPELHYMRGPGPKWRAKHQG
jgi:hypothetical protein